MLTCKVYSVRFIWKHGKFKEWMNLFEKKWRLDVIGLNVWAIPSYSLAVSQPWHWLRGRTIRRYRTGYFWKLQKDKPFSSNTLSILLSVCHTIYLCPSSWSFEWKVEIILRSSACLLCTYSLCGSIRYFKLILCLTWHRNVCLHARWFVKVQWLRWIVKLALLPANNAH